MRSRFPLARFCLLLFLHYASAQTYDVHQGTSSSKQQSPSVSGSETGQQGQGFGWGQSIEVARQARAAQDAISQGNYAAAVSFAEHAAKAAPQNADLWFLYGYAARLNQQYQVSVDAFTHGLRLQPNSARGMAGLAQTYAKMGRSADAEQLLQRIINSNTKDANSLQLAGELMLAEDPKRSLEILKRAESLQPSAHTDLLIAHAYQRLGDTEQSARYLNRAKSLGPRNPEVLRAVASEYRDQGKYDLAISTLQALPSKSADVQAELAYTYQLAGRQQEAAALYTRLAKAAKGNIGLDLSAAQALANLGRPDEARAFLEDAGRIDGNNYRLHAITGQIAEAEDRLADARVQYELAVKNLPRTVPEGPLYPIELRLNLYELDLRQDNQADARQQLDSAAREIQSAQVAPASRPEMLRLRAAIEAASGNTDAADKDLKEALTLAPNNVNSLLNYGSLQWKIGQKDAARATFNKVLELDSRNRTALASLGYLARDKGDNKAAEDYFKRAANAHPRDYTPHLALGDLYTSEREFRSAETAYERAYERMPNNALIIAGGANAALESHNLDLAQRWLDRAQGSVNDTPQVNRERERYLTWKGDYKASAGLGYKVLEKLPNDREGAVYLAYDLYYMGQYDDARALVNKYEPRFGNDKDMALIAGYLHVRDGKLPEALDDFTRALQRDPKMATAYVNRGFVLNDLRQPEKAAKDFQAALKLQPEYPEAHLGLAFADLQRHRPKAASQQLEIARKHLGKNHAWHLAKAESFRQMQDFKHAIDEYRIALSETPNDLPTELAYADALYRSGDFRQSLAALAAAAKTSPSDPGIYALQAQVHAKEGDKDAAHRDIQLADQYGAGQLKILMATGDALMTLGERDAAMQRFSHALDLPTDDRLGVRMALAHLFAEQGHSDDASRQIALGFAEARADSSPVSPEDILSAGNIFLSLHDFDLAETYYDKARLAGANQRSVGVGLTNTYLAEGKTREAQKELASLGSPGDYQEDYDYLMAEASLYRQRQDSVRALSAFAQANGVAGPQNHDNTQEAQYELAEQEGRQINQKVSFLPEGYFGPSLEDINVYTLNAKLLHVANPSSASLLPPPRHSFQNLALSHYRLHLGNLPVISGFVGESMTFGRFLFPSVNVIQDRNTYDTFFNGDISPVLRFGSNSITFTGGLQYTIRRDTISPQALSQNLFKQFLYLSTNSFFNWISIHGSATHEAGPFTSQILHSRDLGANIEFTVGRPWGNTSLLAGYSARDLLFRPRTVEYFTTTSYAGLQHKFGDRLTAAVLAESLRSWQVLNASYATAQAFLPAARFDFRANSRWSIQGSFVLSRGAGYHVYDNAQSEFVISYVRPIHKALRNGEEQVPVSYPLRFSFGLEQQTFYDFPGSKRTTLLPVVHFTLF